MACLLQVRDLGVEYSLEGGPTFRALDGVSFSMAAGEVLGIIGESGCGKSTLALTLLGLLPPNGRVNCGSAVLAGHDLLRADERLLERIRGAEISLIPQEPGIALSPVLRVRDQVADVIRAHFPWGWERCRKEAGEVLAQVFPQDATRIGAAFPHQLSGGQRQRVLIAQAIACRPALIVADEPTASLDATTQKEILALLEELKGSVGVALIVITHHPGILTGLADRVLVMYAGRIVEEGQLDRVFVEPLHPYTRGLLRSIPTHADESFSCHKVRLPVILGNPPDLMWLPPGCAFEPRCSERVPVCTERAPDEVLPNNSSRVRCFKYGG